MIEASSYEVEIRLSWEIVRYLANYLIG